VWVIDTEESITEAGTENSSAKVMPAGTTIISARGTVGRLALTAVPMAMNQSCYGVRGVDSAGDFFVYFSLRDAIDELQQRSHGSVFDTITRDTFGMVYRVRPQPQPLRAFEEAVAPYLHSLRNNRFENRTLSEIRDALLPKLISGQIRVPKADGVKDGQ
jgi:type I restriction enzyme S subunit